MNFWKKFLHVERQLHIRSTVEEMHLVSSVMYGGAALVGLLVLIFPTWPSLDQFAIGVTCSVSFFLALLFYVKRKTLPVYMAILHVPIGVIMLTFAVYSGGSVQSVSIGLIYVLSSSYAFHYFARYFALFVILVAMVAYGFVLQLNGIEGWPAIVVFSMGCCLVMGGIVRLTTRRMHYLVIRDSLTGLLNRRTIDSVVTDLLDEFENDQEHSFTFILLDLNKFKIVNDTQGHLFGDEVLKEVSQVLKGIAGEDDFIARWGGDEFVILLKDYDKAAFGHFETLLTGKLKDVIGFECGVSYPRLNDTIDALIHRADERMYLNKRKRRSTDK